MSAPPSEVMFRGSICLHPNAIFDAFAIVDVTKWWLGLGGGCVVCFGNEKGLSIACNFKPP
jgi:hypothetical protein